MFLNAFLGAGYSTDPDVERDAPPPPTPVSAPSYPDIKTRTWDKQSPPPNLQSVFATVQKPSDVTWKHLEALNIQISPPCPPDQLFPLDQDGNSYLPSISTGSTASVSYADAARDIMHDKKKKELNERLTELRIDNDTAYRVATRNPTPGTRPPRIAYLRKFWESLERVSQYWDASLDHYWEAPPPASSSSDDSSRDPKRPKHAPPSAAKESGDPDPLPRLRYKGRRTSTGREMPDQHRAETVKGLVEAAVWPFHFTVSAPRALPILHIRNIKMPIRQSAAIYRLPKEREKARAGWLNGPAFAVQVRPDTEFEAEGLTPRQREGKARLDLAREVGGLLLLAQQRARQGRTAARPGEGKWWTTTPRWGGGGEVASANGGNGEVADGLEAAKGLLLAKLPAVDAKRRKTPAMLWRELRCGSSTWDAQTEYCAIGKAADSEYDEVFMLSSLNHHVAVLKLTVHAAYSEYLLTGEVPADLAGGEEGREWCRPTLQRTKWYDLFDGEERVEAFTALWGVAAYLGREVGGGADGVGGNVADGSAKGGT